MNYFISVKIAKLKIQAKKSNIEQLDINLNNSNLFGDCKKVCFKVMLAVIYPNNIVNDRVDDLNSNTRVFVIDIGQKEGCNLFQTNNQSKVKHFI